MHYSSTADTIVAVSSGWTPAPLGIVRLSGPESHALALGLGAAPPQALSPAPAWSQACLGPIPDVPDLVWPATVYWFRAPRSYTAQDLVELHMPGALPLLRVVADTLLARGARRALPGEFTARAFLAGRIDPGTVEAVLALLQARQDGDLLRASRLLGLRAAADHEALRAGVLALLARIEAGIDFSDEDDVQFITPVDLQSELAVLRQKVGAARHRTECGVQTRPHVALVGKPNAGKSTLFNALLGTQRAMVSPVLGTTRDVLASTVEFAGVQAILQDCAGLGDTTDALELATHRATERTAAQADLVIWVHALDTPWTTAEYTLLERLPPTRRLMVFSKGDLIPASAPLPPGVPDPEVIVSAESGRGLSELRAAVAARLARSAGGESTAGTVPWPAVESALERAIALVPPSATEVPSLELVALELRIVAEWLSDSQSPPTDEAVLDRIYSQFCLGK